MANETVFTRYEGNPIVTPAHLPGANSIFNSAVAPFGNRYVGVFRCDMTDFAPELHLGWSEDALDWKIDPKPIAFESSDPEVNFCLGYDPRVTELEGKYYITWCNEYHGPSIMMAETEDFGTFRLIENVLAPYNRDAVLFPRKIGGQYMLLHRPSDPGHTAFGDIFVCSSPDLIHWGRHRWVFGPRGGWQASKVGAGPVPIETEEGWLMIYHGVRIMCSSWIYSAGAALLDLEEPWKVIYRTRNYLLSPTTDYECVGDVPNVIFPVATLLEKTTNRLALYYGSADRYVSVAHCQLDELLEFVKQHSFKDN